VTRCGGPGGGKQAMGTQTVRNPPALSRCDGTDRELDTHAWSGSIYASDAPEQHRVYESAERGG
jgi:hypothetical protein